MKSILISPAGSANISTGKQNYGDGLEADFDMLSYLTNEFDNADICALVVELEESPVSVATMQIQLEFLKQAARRVVACWQSGDLAAAVRELEHHSKE
jgi:hypothetical protein